MSVELEDLTADASVADEATDEPQAPTAAPQAPTPGDDRKQLISARDQEKQRRRAAEAERDAARLRLTELETTAQAIRAARTDGVLQHVPAHLRDAARAVLAQQGIDMITAPEIDAVQLLARHGLVPTRSSMTGAPGVRLDTKAAGELPGGSDETRADQVRALAKRISGNEPIAETQQRQRDAELERKRAAAASRMTPEQVSELAQRMAGQVSGQGPVQLAGGAPSPYRPQQTFRDVAQRDNAAHVDAIAAEKARIKGDR